MIIPARGRLLISVYSVSDSYDSPPESVFIKKTKNISSVDIIEVDPLDPPERFNSYQSLSLQLQR